MRSIRVKLSTALTILILVGCASSNEKFKVEIKHLEDSLYADATKMIDRNLAQNLIDKYVEYADEYPDDAEAAHTLFKAGDLSMNLNMSQQAVQLFDRIMDNYPDYERTPQCLFLKGYIFENDIKDLKTAKQIYEQFLVKYPDDEFADDAEISIKNLGKTPEQLIKEFEEQARREEEAKKAAGN